MEGLDEGERWRGGQKYREWKEMNKEGITVEGREKERTGKKLFGDEELKGKLKGRGLSRNREGLTDKGRGWREGKDREWKDT